MSLKSALSLKGLAVLTGISLIFVGACSNEQSKLTEDISVQQAYNLIQDNRNNDMFVILDIRTPQEYAAGYIKGAINIDYYASTFRDDIDKLDKGKTYLVYCRTANRSGAAIPMFEELGFEIVYNMLGGIVGWQASGHPVVVP